MDELFWEQFSDHTMRSIFARLRSDYFPQQESLIRVTATAEYPDGSCTTTTRFVPSFDQASVFSGSESLAKRPDSSCPLRHVPPRPLRAPAASAAFAPVSAPAPARGPPPQPTPRRRPPLLHAQTPAQSAARAADGATRWSSQAVGLPPAGRRPRRPGQVADGYATAGGARQPSAPARWQQDPGTGSFNERGFAGDSWKGFSLAPNTAATSPQGRIQVPGRMASAPPLRRRSTSAAGRPPTPAPAPAPTLGPVVREAPGYRDLLPWRQRKPGGVVAANTRLQVPFASSQTLGCGQANSHLSVMPGNSPNRFRRQLFP